MRTHNWQCNEIEQLQQGPYSVFNGYGRQIGLQQTSTKVILLGDPQILALKSLPYVSRGPPTFDLTFSSPHASPMLKITKLIVGGSEKGKGFLTSECIIADVVTF